MRSDSRISDGAVQPSVDQTSWSEEHNREQQVGKGALCMENGFGTLQVREDSCAVETADEQSVSDPPGSRPPHGAILPYRDWLASVSSWPRRSSSATARGAETSAPLYGRQQPIAVRRWRCVTSKSPQPSSGDDLISARTKHHTRHGPCLTRNLPNGPPPSTSQPQVNSTAANPLMTHQLDSRLGRLRTSTSGRARVPPAQRVHRAGHPLPWRARPARSGSTGSDSSLLERG